MLQKAKIISQMMVIFYLSLSFTSQIFVIILVFILFPELQV